MHDIKYRFLRDLQYSCELLFIVAYTHILRNKENVSSVYVVHL